MGIIKALATLINAFPGLIKLLEKLNAEIKEKNARQRFESKKTIIATAVRDSQYVVRMPTDETQWRGSVSKAPAVSSRS